MSKKRTLAIDKKCARSFESPSHRRENQNTNVFTAFSHYIWPLVNTASYPCLTRPLVNNLLCSFKSIPDMEIRCKSAKDVVVGLYFLLAIERMFTSGKNLTQKLDPRFTKGCFLSLGITAWISDDQISNITTLVVHFGGFISWLFIYI